ncbi:MAG: hypothetical protein AB7J46_03490 [Candidatus Altimarinota bacterium]
MIRADNDDEAWGSDKEKYIVPERTKIIIRTPKATRKPLLKNERANHLTQRERNHAMTNPIPTNKIEENGIAGLPAG